MLGILEFYFAVFLCLENFSCRTYIRQKLKVKRGELSWKILQLHLYIYNE